jgi:hypothetical protein
MTTAPRITCSHSSCASSRALRSSRRPGPPVTHVKVVPEAAATTTMARFGACLKAIESVVRALA